MSTFILRLASGDAPAGAVRVAVKDLIDMAGLPTTVGSKVLAGSGDDPGEGQPAAADAQCLAGIRAAAAAGKALIVGKTNLHELAFGVTGINPWYGTPVNPLDPARVPGGSSSGSAVAVATGEADVALGSDTGGSIRIPAACCGIVGLKTTRGRVPLAGVTPLAPSLDTVGPMGATVAAVGLGMELLEPGFAWEERAPAARIGRFRPPSAKSVDDAVDRALDAWRAAAADRRVVDLDLPGWGTANEAFAVILMSEAWGVHRRLWDEHAAELSPDVAQRLELGSMIDPEEVAAAWETARLWATELSAAFRTADLIAVPTLAEEPPSLDESSRMMSIRHTGPVNLAGVPAIALPVGGAGRKLPASLQLIGPSGAEDLIVATAKAVETTAGPAA
jgi:amidase